MMSGCRLQLPPVQSQYCWLQTSYARQPIYGDKSSVEVIQTALEANTSQSVCRSVRNSHTNLSECANTLSKVGSCSGLSCLVA